MGRLGGFEGRDPPVHVFQRTFDAVQSNLDPSESFSQIGDASLEAIDTGAEVAAEVVNATAEASTNPEEGSSEDAQRGELK